jgi:hypothetical protein
MRPWTVELAGRLDELELESAALKGNHLGDSNVRPLWVYTPPGYDDDASCRYPSVYILQGFTGTLAAWLSRVPFRPIYPELVDELFSAGKVPGCIVVFVDAWTAVGGSQFVDSPGTGDYHTYLCEEVVPFVDARYRTLADRDHRGVQGKSSGGFGAMITPMLRPDLFGALATHAGDAMYEYCYLSDFAAVHRALRDEYGGSVDAFWKDFRGRPALSKASDEAMIGILGVAACFSAEPDGSVLLPFDANTGRLIPEIWQRWLDWDPVRMVPHYADALRSQRAIWVDAGRADEYHLDIGAEAFVAELARIGVDDVHFELFDGTHRTIEYRYPLSLAYLAERLSR